MTSTDVDQVTHPRYRGPIADVHVHYGSETRHEAREILRTGGITTAIHLWDLSIPPLPYAHELEEWRVLEPTLLRAHVPNFYPIGTPGYEENLANEVTVAADLGCKSIKVWKNLGLKIHDPGSRRVRIDDPRNDALFERAAERRIPVLIHIGDPPEMWQAPTADNPRAGDMFSGSEWWYSDGGYPSLEQLHDELEGLVARHPSTMFVGAHFGCFLSVTEIDRFFASYPNFHVETGAAVAEIGRGDVTAARRLFLDWPDRVLFGSDLSRIPSHPYPDFAKTPDFDYGEYFARHWHFFETAGTGLEHPIPEQVPWTVTGIDLPDDVLRSFYWGNAHRLYDLPFTAQGDSVPTA